MLFLSIDEEFSGGGDTSPGRLLRTDGCNGAAETYRAFSARGTVVEHITGSPHLIRQDCDGAAPGAAWVKGGDVRDRRDRDDLPPDQAPTSLVFLPAIPPSLSLWSVLSPEDATSGGGGGGRGAVRLVQVVATAQTPYRYAVILHFWEVADAVVFADRCNGLSLPNRGVMKALFLSGVEVVPAGAGIGTSGEEDEDGEGDEFSFRLRRRRSLSEGVVAAGARARAVAAALQISGSEEFKSSWADRSGGGDDPRSAAARLSCSPTRDRHRDRVRFAGAPLAGARRGRESGAIAPPPEGAGAGADEDGDGGGGRWRHGDGEGGERPDSLSPPPLRQGSEEVLSSSGEGTGGERARRYRGGLVQGEGARAPRRGNRSALGVGGCGVGGGGSRRTELPPCPVCFDRLDPSVCGVRYERTNYFRSDAAAGPGGRRCNHERCDSGQTVAGQAPAAAAAVAASAQAVGAGAGAGLGMEDPVTKNIDDRPVGDGSPGRSERRDEGGADGESGEAAAAAAAAATGGLPAERGKIIACDGADERGPPWEGKRVSEGGWGAPGEGIGRREGGEKGQGGGSGSPALNVTVWEGSNCRVCRSLNVAVGGAPEKLCCETCRIAHNLWICMVCGHIGCGRYTGEHANRHFRLSGHTYSLELSTGRVWDYIGDCFAHRALRGHATSNHGGGGIRDKGVYGHGREGSRSHQQEWDTLAGARGAGGGGAAAAYGGGGAGGGGGGAGMGRDGSLLLYSEGGFDNREGDSSSLKMAVVSREYEALVATQLQEQQRYYEDLIATAVAADAEANAPLEEALTEEERAEVAKLRRAVDELTGKYEEILDSLREDEETARRVRSENRVLVSEQRLQKQEESRLVDETRQTKRQCEQQMAELEGQMQDLVFFLKAQEEVKSSPRREELVGGSLMMGEGSSGSAGSAGGILRGGGKESERERLARRLKERSHARRAGSRGARPNR